MLGFVTDSVTLSSTLISFASFVRIVDVADHSPGTIPLLFPERCLPRISKDSVRRRANWSVWRLPSGTRADSFFLAMKLADGRGRMPRLRSYRLSRKVGK